jgi:fused signal recognition particle receptor
MGLFSLFKRKRADPEPARDDAPPGEAAADDAAAGAGQASAQAEQASVDAGLERTRARMSTGLRALFSGRAFDDELAEQIEEELLLADLGVDATRALVDTLHREARRARSAAAVRATLRQTMIDMLVAPEPAVPPPAPGHPWVMLVVGVNGAGKTTTIGKLGQRLHAGGYGVLMAAGDTFRAAAVEQLQQWGERVGVAVIAQPTGADSAAVVHDALNHARARSSDVVLADTAGRLHTQSNLMDELRKVHRVVSRFDATAPHETLLVVDGGSGQNALAQARHFREAVNVTGIAITKLDGTAKGGMAFAMVRETGLPIRFIGVGERPEDLRPFDPEAFVDALLGNGE